MRFPNYSLPKIEQADIDAVTKVLSKNEWLAGNGPVTRQFEDAIAEYAGYKYAIAVNSATSGLFVAYRATELTGTVALPALTFVATANMLLAVGGIPVIRDIDVDTWTSETAISVSFAGYPIKTPVFVIDDAHYLHSDMAKPSYCLVSVTSLHPLKHITSGEGGVIFTNDEYLYREMSKLVDQGRGRGNSRFGFGYNFRLPDINSALALSQLKRHPETLAHKRLLAHEYYRLLEGSSLTLPPYHKDHAWHLFVVLVPETEDILPDAIYRYEVAKKLKDREICVGHHYPPLYAYPHLAQYKAEDCPVTEMVWNRGISLPLYPDMTLGDVGFICDNLLEILDDRA